MRFVTRIVPVMLAIAMPAFAGTHTLTINSAGTSITCAEHSKSDADLATLFSESAHDTLSDGDTVTLTPNGTVAWNTGKWTIAKTKSAQTWLDINANNCTLYAAGSAGSDFVMKFTHTGWRFRNFVLRGTGTSGGEIHIDATSHAIDEFIIDNGSITLHQNNGASTQSPVTMTQTASNAISGTFNNFTIAAGTGLPDGIGLASASPTVAGRIFLVNCVVGGCNQTAVANAVSFDYRTKAYIIGGEYFGSGGCNIGGGGTGFPSRLFMSGVRVHDGSIHRDVNNAYDTFVYEVQGVEYMENCYLYNAINGVLVASEADQSTQAVIKNCVIEHSKSREVDVASMVSTVAGVGVKVNSKHAIIENCVIDGWGKNNNAVSARVQTAISTNGGANFSMTVRNCWLKDCFTAVGCGDIFTARDGFVWLDSNLMTGTPGNPTFSGGFLYLVGASASGLGVRLTNNVISSKPTVGTNNYTIIGSNVLKDALEGGNWVYSSGGTQASGWTISSGSDTNKSSQTAADEPLIDAYGRQLANSPCARWCRADKWGAYTFNHTRIGTALVTATVAPTVSTCSIDDTNVTGYWNNQAVMFVGNTTAALAGVYRRVVASTNNATDVTLTFEEKLDAAPAAGDKVMLLPLMIPTSGNLSVMGEARLVFDWPVSLQSFDAFGRVPWPTASVNLASGLISSASIAPGPFSATVPQSDFRRGAPSRGYYPGWLDSLKSYRDK